MKPWSGEPKGAWIWFVLGAVVGAVPGFFGYFGYDRWTGAAVGAGLGLLCVGWQIAQDKRKELPPRPAKGPGELPSQRTAPARPTRTILWRRSKRATHAGYIFFYAGVAAVFFVLGLVLATPEQTSWLAVYGLGVAVAFLVGLHKRRAAKREVAESLRIVCEGATAEAMVESMEHKQLRGGGSPFALSMGWIVSYSFVDGRGDTQHGESGILPQREAESYRSGDRVTVIYDPNQPERSVWAEK